MRKGNPRGFSIIKNTLASLATLYDDEEIIVMQSVVGSVAFDFIEEQTDIEGGNTFLKDFAGVIESIAKAYATGDAVELNKQYRRVPIILNQRWKESRRLKEIE